MVVKNTSLAFIRGTFHNLEQGQKVNLLFGGISYPFVANYHGGTGNDVVLQWGNTRLATWGGKSPLRNLTKMCAPARAFRTS